MKKIQEKGTAIKNALVQKTNSAQDTIRAKGRKAKTFIIEHKKEIAIGGIVVASSFIGTILANFITRKDDDAEDPIIPCSELDNASEYYWYNDDEDDWLWDNWDEDSFEEDCETLSVIDAALIWLSSGKDEDYMFDYSREELEAAC